MRAYNFHTSRIIPRLGEYTYLRAEVIHTHELCIVDSAYPACSPAPIAPLPPAHLNVHTKLVATGTSVYSALWRATPSPLCATNLDTIVTNCGFAEAVAMRIVSAPRSLLDKGLRHPACSNKGAHSTRWQRIKSA